MLSRELTMYTSYESLFTLLTGETVILGSCHATTIKAVSVPSWSQAHTALERHCRIAIPSVLLCSSHSALDVGGAVPQLAVFVHAFARALHHMLVLGFL